jgi:N-acetylglutamate synthase-like GNAT family acetyltransferase
MMDGLKRSPIAAQDPGFLGTLGEAALPIEDLPISNGHFFRFEQNGVLVGFGGFEPYGGDALLRSVVVTPSMRGRGTGRAIAEALAVEMRAAGIERAFLLTTTAEDFFRHLGFVEIARGDAPATILATPQATTICSSAALLSKRL